MATLDRQDIEDTITKLFQADSTLFGQGGDKLIPEISNKWQEWDDARVDRRTPYKMYLKASNYDKVEARMQSADYLITCDYRVEGRDNDPDVARKRLDDISERIDYLIDNVMWSGDHYTTYYTNSEATVINTEHVTSVCDVFGEGDPPVWRAHLEGSIEVYINRIKDNS